MKYEIYTDGACQPNPGTGGWAFILYRVGDSERITKSGAEKDTTNNRMELKAVLEGLKHFRDSIFSGSETLHLFCDSEYLVKGIVTWAEKWASNGWKRKDGKPVLNQDLWSEIHQTRQSFPLECTHVRSHIGIPINEECDKLANLAIKNA